MEEQDRKVLYLIHILPQNQITGKVREQVKGSHYSSGGGENVLSSEKIPSYFWTKKS